MKPSTSVLAIRPSSTTIATAPAIRPFLCARQYATQNSLGTTAQPGPRRRKVTAFNDDGRVPWNQLSAGEKTARATQQSFNFGLVIVGIVLTGGVTYFLWSDVFSPDGKTAQFNRAVDKIREDARCLEILGRGKKISAHGDETFNSWRRARPVSSMNRQDPDGTEHLLMHFYVQGPKDNGTVRLHMFKRPDMSEFEYKYLFLDVKGHERIYLEKQDESKVKGKKQLSFFGIKW
ncbi:import inner membrane translocase subunit tim-21 [Emericellopsis atlantica]|uniref:Mitochondrial import inner membrane translocase subunit Tim21 n=1 Tax=Emericellopsis atlantica TaxID=2614577 RepID=A0A9P7ZVE6_9HYPO|nr:import inner membrane translocase subunit tim-21 [Emericellopsis atlantica]KAG9259069.1 import inner membrane translocase subunit tim-21 [Emericellopsis atlantica]